MVFIHARFFLFSKTRLMSLMVTRKNAQEHHKESQIAQALLCAGLYK